VIIIIILIEQYETALAIPVYSDGYQQANNVKRHSIVFFPSGLG